MEERVTREAGRLEPAKGFVSFSLGPLGGLVIEK